MTMVQLAHVNVNGHNYNVVISACTDSGNIHIFKYNDRACEYEVFGSSDEAADFISKPVTLSRWIIKWD